MKFTAAGHAAEALVADLRDPDSAHRSSLLPCDVWRTARLVNDAMDNEPTFTAITTQTWRWTTT